MNRVLLLSLLASTAVGGYVTALIANPPVELQPSSPGVQQVGNVNVSGKVLAADVVATDAGATAQAVVGNATSTTGANYGGLFKTASSAGTGVRGVATATTGSANGGTFQSGGPTGAGIRGFATALSGVNYGVYGKATSPEGFAGFFVGRSSTTGDAYFGSKVGIGPVTTPFYSLVQIKQDAANEVGSVWVRNGAPGSFFFSDRRGLVSQAGGPGQYVTGVAGTANSMSGGNSYGLMGIASGSGPNYAVHGWAINGPPNFAGYFDGLLYAASSTAGVKSFMIDHPLDPENKVLTHSSVESDQRMNLYRGEVRTDANGFATVAVPGWFDALNEDIQYQLTVIDEGNSTAFTQAKIVQRLRNGKFKLRTSSPGTTVNWMLTGKRHDPTSEHYPLEVERMKTDGERGKYYEPEAFGKDRSLGMGYVPMKTEEHQNPPRR